MTTRYLQTVFTPNVKAAQTANGSRSAYSRHDEIPTTEDRLSENERAFIQSRDSFYLASVTETGWPYIQHRGGPMGFVRALDDQTLGFADYRGNRQYVSVGNIAANDRVALFFMDYPNRARLKLMGRMRSVEAAADPSLAETLRDADYSAKVERLLLIRVEAFDWNCSQHITPRLPASDVVEAITLLKRRIAELEAQLASR
jgi:predicted pyridoxine 5'-phosphate oxidase superfamily flavin-nucleotide-binding protein